MKKSRCVGIDLGTTNSEVAIVVDGKVQVIAIDGSCIMPSVVSLDSKNKILVGSLALNNRLAAPDHTVSLIKRKMGKDELLSLGGNNYTPAMISSLILSRLKLAAEEYLKEPVTQAVITVPAFFNERQRAATKEAGELAGFEVLRLLNEPTAAARAYNFKKATEETCLVYDLGGGTFDVSIVQFSDGIMEVRASNGDTELGGSDFDRMIAEKANAEFIEEHGIDLSKDILSWNRLLIAAEKAKIALSTEAYADMIEEFIYQKDGKSYHLNFKMTRVAFENMVGPILEKTLNSVKKSMEQACCKAEDLHRVILVGGSTYIPKVSQLLERELNILPQIAINPSTAVAQGAAIEAANLTGEEIGSLMVDITPHSLGIKVFADDHMENAFLIRRNTVLPAVASQIFSKVHEDQDVVAISVYQGESLHLEHNQFLDEFQLTGLAESWDSDICVKFELDRSGLLIVSATDVDTGKKVNKTIQQASKMSMKNVHLADLSKLDFAIQEQSFVEETLEKEEKKSLNEEIIQRAMNILRAI